MRITPTISEDALNDMLATGLVRISTRGIFTQFVRAYEEMWVRKLRTGGVHLRRGAPSVTVLALHPPDGWDDFLKRHPNAIFQQRI